MMTHFVDLTTYSFLRCGDPPPLNIGWLDKSVEFDRGKVSKRFIKKLLIYYDQRKKQTRGRFRCNLCRGKNRTESDWLPEGLGSAEVWVVSNDGRVFACPDLLIHYIADHGYRPPQDFIDAVLTGPSPGSEEYEAAVVRTDRNRENIGDE